MRPLRHSALLLFLLLIPQTLSGQVVPDGIVVDTVRDSWREEVSAILYRTVFAPTSHEGIFVNGSVIHRPPGAMRFSDYDLVLLIAIPPAPEWLYEAAGNQYGLCVDYKVRPPNDGSLQLGSICDSPLSRRAGQKSGKKAVKLYLSVFREDAEALFKYDGGLLRFESISPEYDDFMFSLPDEAQAKLWELYEFYSEGE